VGREFLRTNLRIEVYRRCTPVKAINARSLRANRPSLAQCKRRKGSGKKRSPFIFVRLLGALSTSRGKATR
jgi:hypothetical protein